MKKLKLFILLSILSISNTKAQTNWFKLEYKYIVGDSIPGNSWIQPDYVDAFWKTGEGTIGFGDTINKTLISTATSLYVRYTFIITDADTINLEALSLNTFFDDGFIAYLNGYEFARVNMGNKSEPSIFNTLAKRSHESQLSTRAENPVPGYYIKKSTLKDHLNIGKNSIAVELHNDSINGSDLSLNCNLQPIFYDDNASANSFIYMNELRTKACVELDSSYLPIVIINSNEYGIPYAHIEVIADMKIINNNIGAINKPSDETYDYSGQIKIEIRGNSSSLFPKQSFNFETQNLDGSNNNVSLLGLPTENDWILFGPFADKSLIRNKFIYELGSRQGYYEPRTKNCELILNGEYVGLYTLTERIKPDKNRLDISKLTTDDTEGYAVTGGYIFYTDTKNKNIIFYPHQTKMLEEQLNYISNFIEKYNSMLYSNNFIDKELGYKKYIDTESLLDYIIINELANDWDKYDGSTILYKDRNDKDSLIKFGPLWDYDFCLGNFWTNTEVSGWKFDLTDMGIQRYFQDTSLVHRFAQKWHDQRKQFLQNDSLIMLMDSLLIEVAESQKKNHEIWPYLNRSILAPSNNIKTYEEEITKMKSYIQKRANWIDMNIDAIFYPLVTYSSAISIAEKVQYLKVYPNPFVDNLNIEMPIHDQQVPIVEIYNLQGVKIKTLDVEILNKNRLLFQWNTISKAIPMGIYLINVSLNGKSIGNSRVVKKN